MSNDLVPIGDAVANLTAYLATVGGAQGDFIKFTKEGEFVIARTGEKIPSAARFVCVWEQTRAGWIKFNGKGNEPTRHMGPICQGYVPPNRGELGDDDKSMWEDGLNGKPADPWNYQMQLPLINLDTSEPFVFNTMSASGRNAIHTLLRNCTKAHKRNPDHYPVIELAAGGFKSKDPRVGFVKAPEFNIISSSPRGEVKMVSPSEDMEDEVPF